MTSIYRRVFDEIGDQISSSTYDAIRNIDSDKRKIASLEAIEAQMQQAADNATFQLVTQLPSTGKSDVYYIVLNSTTNRYEEYSWNGTSFDKVGQIGDSADFAALPYQEVSSLPASGAEGIVYIYQGDEYTWDGTQFEKTGSIGDLIVEENEPASNTEEPPAEEPPAENPGQE